MVCQPQVASGGQAPMPLPDIVTFSRGQHAVHAVGGRCELWEGWVPAFQDVGSVNIPAIRKHESGPLTTVHLSPWPTCPVSTVDLDRPENEGSEWLSRSPRCLRTQRPSSRPLPSPAAWAFLVCAGHGPAETVTGAAHHRSYKASSLASLQGTRPQHLTQL